MVNCKVAVSARNQLPLSLRQPHCGTSSSISYSPIHSPIISSSFDSPLCSSITASLFHCRLKNYRATCFTKSYPRSFTSSSRSAFTDYCLDRFFWFLTFCSFSLFFVSVLCARLGWPSPQLLSARK